MSLSPLRNISIDSPYAKYTGGAFKGAFGKLDDAEASAAVQKPDSDGQKNLFEAKRAAFEEGKTRNNNDLMAHEQAHKDAAGIFGGPIVIESDENGVGLRGHVNIQMPALDKQDPQKTINHAKIVDKAAMAPKDPSPQDFVVSGKALQTLFQAEQALQKKKEGKGDDDIKEKQPFVLNA